MKFKIRTKITSGFAIMIALILLVSYLGISGLRNTKKEYDVAVKENIPISSYIWEVRSDTLDQVAALRGYLVYKDERYIELFNEINSSKGETYKNIEKLIDTEQSKQCLSEIINVHKEYEEIAQSVFQLGKSGDFQKAYVKAAEGRDKVDKIQEITEKWIQWVDKQNTEIVQGVEEELNHQQIKMIIFVAVAIIIGVIISIFMSLSISNPVIALTNAANKVADGDLSQSVREIKTGDEIETLSKAFDTMVSNLKNLIQKVNQSSQLLASSSEQLSASSQEVSSASMNISNTVTELAQGTTTQAQATEDANIIVNNMWKEIIKGSENAKEVSNTSIQVLKTANEGLTVSEGAVKKIQEVKNTSVQTSNVIKLLGQESEKIGVIVGAIQGIASQTNLLALNAAIEAARAGEHGKGFAVVAEEVRKLAEESSQSAQEIVELVKNIQNETGKAVVIIEQSSKEVEEGVLVVNKTGETFKAIASEVDKVVYQIKQVSDTSESIANNSEEIVKSITNIASIAEETAASSEEISATTEEQTASMQQIAESSLNLRSLAEELETAVEEFKL
ncbi:methyl-accepting chemotaxis protein [Clostridium sp. ZS2-4]|uniref:methyl-accepting chemotaxis protein n=1 Tax=Clostridium sp. ZS2-4 TaxID=2987703 RepID=UPI00227B570A|nr:methyl-accepting chemotaxis protein [Clostridium sp. ZS2-4]MCY6355298.1 methyl-accepting chemotaxis protein [Clostridium sp. ZS2-4]